MTLTREKYRRLPELYTVGTELVLLDGTVMWLQIINPFEVDEAIRDGHVARSRFVLAFRESGSGDQARLRAAFMDQGRDKTIQMLLDARRSEALLEVIDELRVDETWRDKAQLVERGDGLLSVPSEAEREYQAQVEVEYATEVSRRMSALEEYAKVGFESCSDEQLWESYEDWFLESRGAELGMAEYRLTEMLYAARACAATRSGDGWDHGGCDSHRVRVFESKEEIRHLPEQLLNQIRDALAELSMSEREAKNSVRLGSSSESSPQPNAPVDSQPSTPAETSVTVPGLSPLPQTTP